MTEREETIKELSKYDVDEIPDDLQYEANKYNITQLEVREYRNKKKSVTEKITEDKLFNIKLQCWISKKQDGYLESKKSEGVSKAYMLRRCINEAMSARGKNNETSNM